MNQELEVSRPCFPQEVKGRKSLSISNSIDLRSSSLFPLAWHFKDLAQIFEVQFIRFSWRKPLISTHFVLSEDQDRHKA